MAETVLFDSASQPFDGTSFATRNLTDIAGNFSQSGGGLHTTGAGGFQTGYLVSATPAFYGKVTAIFNPATIVGTPIFCFRRQSDTTNYFISCDRNGLFHFYTLGTDTFHERLLAQTLPSAAQNAVNGLITMSVELHAAAGGTTSFLFSSKNSDGSTIRTFSAPTELGIETLGQIGVGAFGGAVDFSAVRISSFNEVALARAANEIITCTDSIGFGYASSNPPTTGHIRLTAAALGSTWDLKEFDVPAAQAVGFLGSLSQFAPHFAQAYTKKIGLIALGTNDLTQTDAQTTANAISSLAQSMKAAGATTVYLHTVLHHGDNSATDAKVNPLNALINAGLAGVDAIIPGATTSGLTDPTSANFAVDHLHLSDSGQQVLSAAELSVIRQLYPASTAAASSAALSADGKTLTVLFAAGSTLGSVGDPNAWTLSNAGGLHAPSLSSSGLALTFTLRRPAFAAETLTLSCSGGGARGSNGVALAPFSGLAVVNGSARLALGPPAALNVSYPNFTWPAVAGATGYRLYANGVLVYDTANAAAGNTATAFTDPAATDGRPVDQPTFTVSAYNGAGEGPQSATAAGIASLLLQGASVGVTVAAAQKVQIDDARYDIPAGVLTLVPVSVQAVLQQAGLV